MEQTTTITIPAVEKRPKPESLTDEVRRVDIGSYLEATQCLAEAFAADDVSRYFIDTPDNTSMSAEAKWKLHFNLMSYIVAAHCYNGIVTTVGPDNAAVALWMPPGKNMDDIFTMLRSGLWRLLYQLPAEGRRRFFHEFFPLLHSAKASILGARDADAYYLVYVGTKPGGRGRGYARRLIEDGTRRADAEGRAVYLESSAGANVPFYERCGFALVREIALCRAEKEVRLGCMVREPRVEGGKGASAVGREI